MVRLTGIIKNRSAVPDWLLLLCDRSQVLEGLNSQRKATEVDDLDR